MSTLYETTFRRALFPFYESCLRGRGTVRHLGAYERDQWLAPEQLAAVQWRRLRALLEHCQREVPFYRERWHALGLDVRDLRSLDDYAQLPVLTKADIREHRERITAESWRGRLLYKTTGGSTGEPLRFGYTRESNDRRQAVMWRGYGWSGARMGRRTLLLWGGAVGDQTRAQRWKDRVFHRIFARRVLDSFHMTEANIADYADAIDRYRPEVIVGYVGPLMRLAQWLLATGRRVHRPAVVLGAAEALHEFQRSAIAEAFTAPVFNTYGCREFMLIAAECEHRRGLHINADHLVVELRTSHGAAQSGEIGEVVITDLFNFGMPFIRYVNGDLASPCDTRCRCGRGLPMLERIEGRKLDAIRTPAGHLLPGEFFPHMLKDVPGLERFRLVQRQINRLELTIVRGPTFDDASLAYIQREIGKVLGDSVELHYDFVDAIPLTASGKLRVTVSELEPVTS